VHCEQRPALSDGEVGKESILIAPAAQKSIAEERIAHLEEIAERGGE
jgi:hypothetical protein